MEKGMKVTIGSFKQLKEAWEEYDEWSEDYAWQEGETAYVLDMDEADGTVLLKFVEEAPEIKEEEEEKPKATFQTAPIKHIKQKTLAPFKKKFKQSLMYGAPFSASPLLPKLPRSTLSQNRPFLTRTAAATNARMHTRCVPACCL